MIFVFIFPAILGTIGGMLPLVIAILKNMDYVEKMANITHIFELINIMDVIVISGILFICTIIICFYFLKIVFYERTAVIVFLFSTIFVLSFLQSLIYAIAFF